MTPQQITRSRLTAYTPPYVKQAVIDYVAAHPETTVSQFIKEAIKEKLHAAGALHKPHIIHLGAGKMEMSGGSGKK